MTPAENYDINSEVYDFAIGKINKGFGLPMVWNLVQNNFSGWDIGNPEAANIRAAIEEYYWN